LAARRSRPEAFERVFSRLDPDAFERRFVSWIKALSMGRLPALRVLVAAELYHPIPDV